MNILIIKKNISRFFLLMLCMLTIVVGLYAAIEFSEGFQVCKVTPGMTWQDLETEFGMPADIIAQYNGNTTDTPLKDGMRIKIPYSYKVIAEEKPQVAQPVVTLSDNAEQSVTVTVGANQIAGWVATITSDDTEIRSLPNGGGVLLYNKTKKGMTMLVTGENAAYYSVLMGDGDIGWVSKIGLKLSGAEIVERPDSFIEKTPVILSDNIVQTELREDQKAGYLATVTADYMEIRSLPNGDGMLLYDRTKKGITMLVVGEDGAYYSVLMADGTVGWVDKAGLKLSDREVVVDKPEMILGKAPMTISDDIKSVKLRENQIVVCVAQMLFEDFEIRSQPDDVSTIFYKVRMGDTLLVTGALSYYYSILMSDGTFGWLPSFSLQFTGEAIVVVLPEQKKIL